MSRVPPLNFRREDIPDLSTGERTDKLIKGLNAFGDEAGGLLNGGLTFSANFRAFAKEITIKPEDDWVALTPTTPWTADTLALSARKIGRRVEFRGGVARNTGTDGSAVASLPAHMAPETDGLLFPSASYGVPVIVSVSGTTITAYFAANPDVVRMNGVFYDAADSVEGTNGVFPISIKNEIPGTPAPSHVWVTRAVDITNSREEPVALGGIAWTTSKDQIVIRDIANLYSGRRYKVTILVVAE